VVSGTAWKRHALNDDGLLTAEYTRGPVIVWASTGLEGYSKFISEVVAKAARTPGPRLEDRIEELNTAQVFERFQQAARGKVRPSVRWKTGRRPRRRRKLEALADLRYSTHAAGKRAAGRVTLSPYLPAKTAKARRAARLEAAHEHRTARLRVMAPAHSRYNPDGIDLNRLEWWEFWGVLLCRMQGEGNGRPYPKGFRMPESRSSEEMQPDTAMVAYFALMGKTRELASVLSYLRVARPRPTLGEILAAFQRAEYRAHLARRVKPAPRYRQIRRPLYAQPRPPSAPLAPPVS